VCRIRFKKNFVSERCTLKSKLEILTSKRRQIEESQYEEQEGCLYRSRIADWR